MFGVSSSLLAEEKRETTKVSKQGDPPVRGLGGF